MTSRRHSFTSVVKAVVYGSTIDPLPPHSVLGISCPTCGLDSGTIEGGLLRNLIKSSNRAASWSDFESVVGPYLVGEIQILVDSGGVCGLEKRITYFAAVYFPCLYSFRAFPRFLSKPLLTCERCERCIFCQDVRFRFQPYLSGSNFNRCRSIFCACRRGLFTTEPILGHSRYRRTRARVSMDS